MHVRCIFHFTHRFVWSQLLSAVRIIASCFNCPGSLRSKVRVSLSCCAQGYRRRHLVFRSQWSHSLQTICFLSFLAFFNMLQLERGCVQFSNGLQLFSEVLLEEKDSQHTVFLLQCCHLFLLPFMTLNGAQHQTPTNITSSSLKYSH